MVLLLTTERGLVVLRMDHVDRFAGTQERAMVTELTPDDARSMLMSDQLARLGDDVRDRGGVRPEFEASRGDG